MTTSGEQAELTPHAVMASIGWLSGMGENGIEWDYADWSRVDQGKTIRLEGRRGSILITVELELTSLRLVDDPDEAALWEGDEDDDG